MKVRSGRGLFARMDAMRANLGWDTVMGEYHGQVLGPFHPHVGPTAFHTALHAALTAAAARASHRPVRVLDAGCGPGNLVDVVAAADVAVELVGVDASEPGLDIARQRATAAGVTATFTYADLTTVDLGRRFDVVVAVNSVLPVRAAHTPRRDVPRILERLAAHLDGPHARLVAALPAFDAVLAELHTRAATEADDPAAARFLLRRLRRELLVDDTHRLADNGFGVPHCLHDPATIRAEVPAAGLALLTGPDRMDYPTQVAAAYCCPGGSWDWLITATAAVPQALAAA